MSSVFPNLIVAHIDNLASAKCLQFGRSYVLPEGFSIEDYVILYIGEENLFLTNCIYTWNRCKFFSYNPTSQVARAETINVNRLLMKRYAMVEKAKDAQIIGILVGTLGVSDYLQVISRLKTLIEAAGKKSYTIVVGKLNVAKLANFAEVEVFVLVACPENTLLDSSDFYQPVITPFELELACNVSREWTGDYVMDFHDLLPGQSPIFLSKCDMRSIVSEAQGLYRSDLN
jgi:diphthamide biosynthesis protein 2